ncbi:unnamed protein product [Notodromas monacha]|uniref:Uncharacterized protein n=1 Tax=Notodromas monacha TaxID=399045 RepID=A0A7R9BCR8_9CRUS|nr:unnamed protein product [Notodromas monacha]CAG0912943.1 unnamed protein product [Notodromas monacha]
MPGGAGLDTGDTTASPSSHQLVGSSVPDYVWNSGPADCDDSSPSVVATSASSPLTHGAGAVSTSSYTLTAILNDAASMSPIMVDMAPGTPQNIASPVQSHLQAAVQSPVQQHLQAHSRILEFHCLETGSDRNGLQLGGYGSMQLNQNRHQMQIPVVDDSTFLSPGLNSCVFRKRQPQQHHKLIIDGNSVMLGLGHATIKLESCDADPSQVSTTESCDQVSSTQQPLTRPGHTGQPPPGLGQPHLPSTSRPCPGLIPVSSCDMKQQASFLLPAGGGQPALNSTVYVTCSAPPSAVAPKLDCGVMMKPASRSGDTTPPDLQDFKPDPGFSVVDLAALKTADDGDEGGLTHLALVTGFDADDDSNNSISSILPIKQEPDGDQPSPDSSRGE